jgi:hypothetical protein
MAEELISSYVDQAAIKSQTDFLIRELERAKTQYKSLSDAIKNIKGSTSFSDTSKIAQQAEKEQQALLKTQQQIIKAKQEQVKLENQLLQQQILQEKQAQANLKTTQAQGKVKQSVVTESITKPGFADDISKTGAVVSAFDKAQAEAAISATEFGNSLNKQAKVLKDEVIPAVKQTTLSKKQLALAQAEGKLLAQQEAAALKNQVREELAVKGSLEQRRAALIRLNAVYDNQSPAERASASGQRLQKILGGLDSQVKTLESTTGRAQRNVGNYSSALGAIGVGAQKAFSGIRKIANILPGLGLSGVFLLGYQAIVKVIEAISGLTTKLFGLNEQRKLSTQINEEAAKSAGKEQASLLSLKAAIESTSVPMENRLQAIKNLKKEFPALFDGLTNEQLLTGNVAGAYDKATAAILRKARATAATTELEKIASEKFEIIRKSQEAADIANEKIRNAKATKVVVGGSGGSFSQGASTTTLSATREVVQKQIKDKFDLQKKADQEELDQLNKKQKFLLQFVIDGADETVKVEQKKEKKIAKETAKSLSDRLSQSFERFKLEQENLLQLLKEGAEDERSVYDTRLRYLDVFNTEQKVLINEQLDYDLQRIEEKRLKDVKAAKGRADEIEIINFNASEAAKTAKLKADLAIEASDKKHFEARKKLREEFNKVQQDFADQEYEYERELAEKLEKLRLKRLEDSKKFNKTDAELLEERKKKMLSFLDTVQNYFTQVSSIISGALNIGFTKKKNESQLAIEEIEKQRDAELKANDARVQSEQDKAANIAIINSRAEQQKRQQEQRQREVDRKQAQADKALSIFQITLNIAKAVASHLGKPYLIALDLALGAAQLAIAVATPIPRFKHGKKAGQAYEGPGIVNDGPNMEVIERADGSIEMPQGRNVLTHVGANDIIHPDKDAWVNAVLSAAMRDSSNGMRFTPAAKGDNGLAAAMIQQTKLLKKIADKPVSTTSATDRGLVQVINWGARQIKYVNENTNW